MRFLDHKQRRTTVGRTPLDELASSLQRPLPDNTQHSQETNVHASGRIQTHGPSRRAAADLRHEKYDTKRCGSVAAPVRIAALTTVRDI